MAIQDDFNVDTSNNIRQDVAFVPGTHTRYSTLALHAWLQDMADDSSATPDDYVDILDANPSELAGKRNAVRPMALTLLNGFNINDATAQWFKFGSIEQAGGDVLYTGLKVLGSLVTSSPIYIYQNGAKITKYWADADASNFQILVKAKGSSGDTTLKDITVFSRKYGQTFSHFDVDLSPGGEQVAALSTAIDPNIEETAGDAETIFGTITLGFAGYTWDSGDGNGTKNYTAKITLDGTTTLKRAYNAMQWACSENSTETINSVPGWRFRKLGSFAENISAPFGSFAGGKWFLAQGWLIEGVMSADSKNFQLISDDGTIVTPPTTITIEVTNCTTSDYVLVGRDNSGSLLTNEYTVTATAGATSINVTGLKADTPASGSIRISGNKHTYTGWTGTTVSGLSPAVPVGGYSGADAFIPFIDGVPSGATITSAAMQFSSNFTARFRVRRGDAVSPIVPFESTLAVTSNGGSGTTVRNADA